MGTAEWNARVALTTRSSPDGGTGGLGLRSQVHIPSERLVLDVAATASQPPRARDVLYAPRSAVPRSPDLTAPHRPCRLKPRALRSCLALATATRRRGASSMPDTGT